MKIAAERSINNIIIQSHLTYIFKVLLLILMLFVSPESKNNGVFDNYKRMNA
jgi:hypothetical protein